MNWFFFSDVLANSALGWCIFPSISHTVADHLGSWAKLFCTSARGSCCVTTADYNIITKKDDCKGLNQELETFTTLHEKCYKSAKLLLFITQKWQHQSLFLSGQKIHKYVNPFIPEVFKYLKLKLWSIFPQSSLKKWNWLRLTRNKSGQYSADGSIPIDFNRIIIWFTKNYLGSLNAVLK